MQILLYVYSLVNVILRIFFTFSGQRDRCPIVPPPRDPFQLLSSLYGST